MADKVTLSFQVTPDKKAALQEFQELMGFSSQSQAAEFFLRVGMSVAQLASNRPLDASDFAEVLYTVGTRIWAGALRDGLNQTIENFEGWKRWQQTPSSSPIRQLSPAKS